MGYLKIITAILIWSSLGILVRKTGLPTLSIVFYPAAIGGALQLLMLLKTGQMRDAVRMPDNSAKSILLLSLVPFFFLANAFLFYFAFTHTTIANAVLSHYTAPVFVALMAPLFLKERILKITWLAIIIASLGLWLILRTPASGELIFLQESHSRGIIAGALSGLTYAFLILIVRGIASRFSALFIIFVQNTVVALILLPFVLASPIPLQSLMYMIIMGVVHSTIASLLYVQGFKTVKANEAAVLGYFEPVGAIILALIFLHEVPGVTALLGGALILFSGFMIVMGRGEQRG